MESRGRAYEEATASGSREDGGGRGTPPPHHNLSRGCDREAGARRYTDTQKE